MVRSSSFDQETADLILARISQGEMLTKICTEEGMPAWQTYYQWMKDRPALKEAHARARLSWADWWAERALQIALDGSQDFFLDEGGKVVTDHANIQRARLQCEQIRWQVGKYAPRTYGERPEPAAEAAEPVTRIQRMIIAADGNAERLAMQDRIRELEEQLGLREPAPRLLTFDPGPLPSRLDGEIVTRLVDVIKARVPQADQREPAAVLDEIMSIIDSALAAEYEATADASSA